MGPASDPREQTRQVTPEASLLRPDGLHAIDDTTKPVTSTTPDLKATRTTIWLHRLSLVIFVIFCIELGMLLTVLPWTKIWTDNSLIANHPIWRSVAQVNFVRGVITGLGLIDVWIGIGEAVHYRDPGKKKDM